MASSPHERRAAEGKSEPCSFILGNPARLQIVDVRPTTPLLECVLPDDESTEISVYLN